MRTPATLSLARASASDRYVIDRYFEELESAFEENGLVDKPCLIFNMDETGMPLDPKPLKIVTWKGHKNPSQVSSGLKSQVTVVGCVSAGGQCLPPMVIWDRKNLPPELAVGEVPGTIYGLSSKGWIDQELFDLWFTLHFLRYAPPARPLLLLMDGHSSHYCPATIKYAAKERVILFTLPPNTTHLTQPLDKAIFGPLKVFWRQACHQFVVKNPGVHVTKHNFSSVFSEAWIQALTPKNIVSGFRTTGVYPPDRNAITLPSDVKQALAQKAGIAYIPLYTPAKRRITSFTPASSTFTDEEHENFTMCYEEEGACNFEDSRYHMWLKTYHPDSSLVIDSPLPTSYHPAVKYSAIGNYFDCPSPPQRRPAVEKSSLRVLTSYENLKRIEQKEKEKLIRLREKEERKRMREEKKKMPKGQKVLKSQIQTCSLIFSDNEMTKFSERYENGYDIASDERYNMWLATFHPFEARTATEALDIWSQEVQALSCMRVHCIYIHVDTLVVVIHTFYINLNSPVHHRDSSLPQGDQNSREI